MSKAEIDKVMEVIETELGIRHPEMKIVLQCAFCTEGIESSEIDPCMLQIYRANMDEDSFAQIFYCHIDCIYKALHENSRKYLKYGDGHEPLDEKH